MTKKELEFQLIKMRSEYQETLATFVFQKNVLAARLEIAEEDTKALKAALVKITQHCDCDDFGQCHSDMIKIAKRALK